MKKSRLIGVVIALRIDGVVGLVLALVLWFAPQETAAQGNQTISLNTGLVGQTGTTLIPLYQLDDDWVISLDPVFPSPLPRPARVVDPVTTTHMKWALTLPNSRWISGNVNKYMNALPTPPTPFFYRIYFTLPYHFSSPNLVLQMRADDIIEHVRLNNTVLYNGGAIAHASASKAGSFLGPPLSVNYSNSTTFQVGINYVEVGVLDVQQVVSGLNVVGAVTYQKPPSGACSYSGQVIDWDLSTGTTFAGFTNPIGTVDPQWNLISVPTGSPGAAYSIRTIGTWVPNGHQAANWITRTNSTNPQIDDTGVYTYRIALPSSLNTSLYSSIKIIIRYAADNSAIVRLNAIQVDSCAGPDCFSAWRPTLTLTPTTLNYLEVQVTNPGPFPTYTGLIVDAKLRLICK